MQTIKRDSGCVPGVWISAPCMAGISLMRRSCISGGMVMDRPWGYKRSDANPSGSSHTWCFRPGKRSTRDSMEGQYLEEAGPITFQLRSTLCPMSNMNIVWVWVPGTLGVLLYVTIEMKTLLHHSLYTRGSIGQVARQLLFRLMKCLVSK